MKNKHFSGRVFSLGACILNLNIPTKRFPELGETFYTPYDYEIRSGGKGLNKAVTAAKQGAASYILSIIAKDDSGKLLLATMLEAGVKTDYLIEAEGKSGLACIAIDEQANNMILTSPGIHRSINDYSFSQVDFKEGDILISTLEFSAEFLEELFVRCKEKGVFIMVDPSSFEYTDDYQKLFKYIDIIKPNEVEAKKLFHLEEDTSYERVLLEMLALGIKIPLVSLGGDGIVFLSDDEIVRMPAYKVESVDSTGAGDVFLGSLAAALSSNEYSLEKACIYANIAAALSTKVLGASNSAPRKADILACM